ncbi:MAG TPA: chromosome segregation protein SMC [Chloroflexi bacterium]|nr:chromosome segregation protein SMC [Chloroflexota bacterium]
MIHRLTRLEMQGYKTFANNTSIEFGDVTCIVGPNGSGKSNIADGVRWVLGEQSFSLLRGRKTADMIFSGSAERAQASMASATIVFDNSDGWLPIDFTEVSLTRRAYRDGQNEYLLNGQKTRLKDVAELLGTVGLAQRTYTVIGQGLVDTALSIKADERRKLFEEAAGIGVYRQKREDSLRKLDQTQRNMERISDILQEIKPRLRTLDRQAGKAQEYKQLKKDLNHLLRIWYGYHWQHAQKSYNTAQEQLDVQKEKLTNLWTEQEKQTEKLTAQREKIVTEREQITSWLNETSQLQSEFQSLTSEIAVSEERSRNIQQQSVIITHELTETHNVIETHALKLNEMQVTKKQLIKDRDKALEQFNNAKIKAEQHKNELNIIKQKTATELIEKTKIQETIFAQQAKYEALNDTNEQLQLEIADAKTEHSNIIKQLAELKKQVKLYNDEYLKAQEKTEFARNERNELSKTLHKNRTTLEMTNDELSEAIDEYERLNNKLLVLSQQFDNQESTSSGHSILKNAKTNGSIKNHLGTLAELITTEQKFETAISAALNTKIQAIVTNDESEIHIAKKLLNKHGGQATVIPLNIIKQSPEYSDIKIDGFIGWANNLVECDKQYNDAKDLFLSNKAICENSKAAKNVAAKLPIGTLAITLEGEIYYSNGAIVIGKHNESHSLILARETRHLPQQIATADSKCQDLQNKKTSAATKLKETRKLYDNCQYTLDELEDHELTIATNRDAAIVEMERSESTHNWTSQLIETLQTRINKTSHEMKECSERIKLLKNKYLQYEQTTQELHQISQSNETNEFAEIVNTSQTNLALADRALKDSETRHEELDNTYQQEQIKAKNLTDRIQISNNQITDIKTRILHLQNKQKIYQDKISNLGNLIKPAEENIHTLEVKMMSLDDPDNQFRTNIGNMEHRHAQSQLELQRKQDRLDTLQKQITDDLGLASIEFADNITGSTPLPFTKIVEHLNYVSELPENIEDTINQLRIRIRRIGGFNPDALQEYEEVKQRHTNLSEQIEDLESASQQLKQIITELDKLMMKEFKNTFEAVAIEFTSMFKRLFNGGNGKLELEEDEDLNSTGVEINVQLPGRRKQGLASLSGGERALTACALVFALLRVSPTPFAVLDEVDAMLDESNVGRFRSILREISTNTQFILITHNRHTVEVADTVFGISMGSDSTSQVISLRPDEV